MTWFWIALIPPVLWALSNLIDEHLVEREVRDPLALTIITGLFAALPAGIVMLTGRLTWPGWETFGLTTAAGILGLLVYYPYLRSLEIAAPAPVILMWNLSPVLVVLGAYAFVGERLRGQEYVAVALLVSSALLAAHRHGPNGQMHWDRALPWMVLASVMYAAEVILIDTAYERTSFANGLGWMSVTVFVLACALLSVRSRTRRAVWQAFAGRTRWLVIGNELLDTAAVVTRDRALSLGSVGLVNAIGGLQPLAVIAFGLIAPIARRLMIQRPTRAEAIRWMVATALAVIGLGLIRSVE